MAVAVAALLCAAVAVAAAGRVPDIPAGHRAQYSLQHADGSYKYGWDTGAGATAQVEGDARNEVRGSYSGGPVSISYTAGVNGYVPVIGAAAAPPPTALLLPPAPAHGAHAGGVKGGWSSGWSSPQVPVHAAPAAPGAGHIGPAGPLRPDGSYSFSYSTGDQSRQESADASNNVRGSFSFRAKDDGHTRTVSYHAGAGTGFVAQGQHLPTPPPAPLPLPQGGASPPAPAWDSQWPEQPEEPEPQPEPAGDAAYQFGYQTGDASRHEASDASGNVQGSYSYVGPDGVQRRVDYEAGAGKGFVARGDHLPKDGDVPAPGGLVTSWQTGVTQQAGSDGGWQQHTVDEGGWQQKAYDGGLQQKADDGSWQQHTADDGGWQQTADGDDLQQQQQHPVQPADVKGSHGSDGSYSFSYSTKDQSREEQGDSKGNVKGSFSFVAKDDGQRRRVDYHAGAATGFVAKGDHLPKPQPSEVQPQQNTATEPGATTEADDIVLDDKIDLRLGDTQQTVDGSGGGDLQQSTRSWVTDEGGLAPTDEPADVQGSRGADGAYQFSYQTPDQSREEQADAKNNVKGSFSFVAPDGVNRRVDYEAGASKGFVAKGDHLPKAEVPGAPGAGAGADEQQTQQPGALPGDDTQQQTQGPWDDVQHGQEPQGPAGDGDVDGDAHSGDASYSYSYETDSSRKQESADAQGNVQGSFSYNDGTGSTKTVTYTARAGEGFNAKGDHLPKPGQFLAAAAAAGVGGSVHGGAWGRGRGPGALRPGVGVKTTATGPRGPGAGGVKTSASWPPPYPGVGVKTSATGPPPYSGVGVKTSATWPPPYPGVGVKTSATWPPPYPGVGVKTSATVPRGPGAGVKTTATWPRGPEAEARWPQGLRPQGSAAAAAAPAAEADPHGPAGEVHVGDAVVRTYLPPGVPGHKVGYVYEAKS
ncbi:Endocuticle structural glycoprotein SgAbd-2 [Frankliniella fusca]|uniref:Endocuticle structural glycoprotein SgAbd-2 n=1 Tax=Frankliniella fusca TaxID=407009 RepID=A0AAE1H587_9NEOP|nr:Endocuticle structural glycoprotein SgAbd-2 [Frankliniella fusca]